MTMHTDATDSGKATLDYLPPLDGFRALSILLVVISHAGMGLDKILPGGLGVTVFFVISGLLITRQMIVEIGRTGSLNIPAFYLRRLFRLAPAAITYILLFYVLLTALGSHITGMQMASGVFYFANYYEIFTGYTAYNHLPILWSLAVEEHFYLLFPFVMLAFRADLRKALPLFCVLVAAILAWRLYLSSRCATDPVFALCGLDASRRISKGTDTIADAIFYGTIITMLLHYYNAAARRWLLGRGVFFTACALMLFSLLYRDPYFRETSRYSLQSIAAAVIMVNILFNAQWAALAKLAAHPALLWVGRRSYSLYLYHYGMLCLMDILAIPMNWMTFGGYLLASFASAAASYGFIEKPMMAVRKRHSLKHQVGAVNG